MGAFVAARGGMHIWIFWIRFQGTKGDVAIALRLSSGIKELVHKLKESGKTGYLISGGFCQMINVNAVSVVAGAFLHGWRMNIISHASLFCRGAVYMTMMRFVT